jgi:hypothetical protein
MKPNREFIHNVIDKIAVLLESEGTNVPDGIEAMLWIIVSKFKEHDINIDVLHKAVNAMHDSMVKSDKEIEMNLN